MTKSIEHQMTEIYCFVDDYLKAHPRQAQWRRSPHAVPRFTDSQVLTIALLQGAFQVASLKQTYRLVRFNFHGHVRLMREDGARFGKSSKGWFFGFKLHALRHITGRFMNIVLLPANFDDREPLLALCESSDGGLLLGDLGYRGQPAALQAQAAQLLLITGQDAPRHKFLLSRVRQAIETGFSQLWHQLIDRVFSGSWNGLWKTIKLKVLFNNIRHAGVVSV